MARRLWEAAPPASKPGWAAHAQVLTVVLWDENGAACITVGHSHYTPDQALALANAVLEAVSKAGEADGTPQAGA
jgi:hypothetical protein